ncbi:hypothetical protein BDZ97DRAFT_1928065 [Flammula alnicola]|nr:hypothetical protein BDZ97DRAFT_1928065 [Flammula alnicola]
MAIYICPPDMTCTQLFLTYGRGTKKSLVRLFLKAFLPTDNHLSPSFSSVVPTKVLTCQQEEELAISNVKITTYDLGDINKVRNSALISFTLIPMSSPARRLWRDYFPEVDGKFFLVDSPVFESFESDAELDALLSIEQRGALQGPLLGYTRPPANDRRHPPTLKLRAQSSTDKVTVKNILPSAGKTNPLAIRWLAFDTIVSFCGRLTLFFVKHTKSAMLWYSAVQ